MLYRNFQTSKKKIHEDMYVFVVDDVFVHFFSRKVLTLSKQKTQNHAQDQLRKTEK